MERRKEASGKERSPEASLNTQKGNGIGEIPILPLSLITGYYSNILFHHSHLKK